MYTHEAHTNTHTHTHTRPHASSQAATLATIALSFYGLTRSLKRGAGGKEEIEMRGHCKETKTNHRAGC